MTRQVLCYGDSNTWGCVPLEDSEEPVRFPRAERWTGVLQDELGTDYWIIDEGLNGRTTTRDDQVEPYRNGLASLLPTLETHHPLDLVIVMLGTNDLKRQFGASPAQIAASAGELVDVIRESGFGPNRAAPQVLLICPPPVGQLRQFAGEFEDAFEKSRQLAPEFRSIASTRFCDFLDAGEYACGSDTDGVHLDRAAHSSLGKAVAAQVKRAFG
jgi:lysophospholipase L1-like esterase